MNANRVEQLLLQKFGQLSGSIHLVDKNDCLVECESVQKMGEFLELLVLWNVNEELSKTVQNQLALIDENINFVLHEFLAVFFHLFRHGSTEKHDLLVVWGFNKDILDISPHTSGS